MLMADLITVLVIFFVVLASILFPVCLLYMVYQIYKNQSSD